MRPPLNAGENLGAMPPRCARTVLRFNEAPAERGGKRRAATRGASPAWLQ